MDDASVNDRLLWMLKVSRTMLATRDIDKLLIIITDTFIEATEAKRGVLLLADAEGRLTQRVGRTLGGESITGEAHISSIAEEVFASGRSRFATDTGQDQELARRHSVEELNLKMMVVVPLKAEGRVLGVIYADGPTTLDSVFTVSNRRAVETLAEHAAAAMVNAQLYERAIRDPLTGLYNSSFFIHSLTEAVTDERVGGVGLLLLDLDHFKRVNQHAGTEAGDAVLKELVTLMADVAAPHLFARYGSDKFAVLAADCGQDTLFALADGLAAVVGAQARHGVQLSASVGGVHLAPGGTGVKAEEMLASANDALATARARGFSQVELIIVP